MYLSLWGKVQNKQILVAVNAYDSDVFRLVLTSIHLILDKEL